MVSLIKYGALSGGEKYNTNILEIDGLSTDTKSITTFIEYGVDGREIGRTNIENGSTFTEIDTGKLFMYDAENVTWYEVESEASFVTKSSFVRGINHRGYNTIAPENTIPAYKLSKQYGFDTVETDVEWTSDEVPVLLHDPTIDRTSDGVGNVSDYTYEELLEFDFGSWKSAAYTGTKIPTFDEFMKLCRNLGLYAYVEIKGDQTSERISILRGIVKKYHMEKNVSWISSSRTSLSRLKSEDSSARIGIIQTLTTAELLFDAANLKTESNTVFIDIQTITDEQIETCILSGIDVEMWAVNSADTMLSANGYISGFTSDSVNAKDVLG